MMEQEGNIGTVGTEKIEATVASETVTAAVVVGPIKLSVSAVIDNKMLLDLLISRLPAGVAQTLGKEVENALFALVPAVATEVAAPSA